MKLFSKPFVHRGKKIIPCLCAELHQQGDLQSESKLTGRQYKNDSYKWHKKPEGHVQIYGLLVAIP